MSRKMARKTTDQRLSALEREVAAIKLLFPALVRPVTREVRLGAMASTESADVQNGPQGLLQETSATGRRRVNARRAGSTPAQPTESR